MATAAQIAANRRNAQRSTGPRTAAGKARVSQNAKQKHGFRSTLTAIPDYDAPLFAPACLAFARNFSHPDRIEQVRAVCTIGRYRDRAECEFFRVLRFVRRYFFTIKPNSARNESIALATPHFFTNKPNSTIRLDHADTQKLARLAGPFFLKRTQSG